MTDHALTNNINDTANSTPKNTDAPNIAIIGGGLSGLITATLLERAFAQNSTQAPQITIFEKSRSVGRLATRYRTDKNTDKQWQWAFGAQFFTAKSESFAKFIKPWLDSGLLQPWRAQVVELTPATNDAQQSDINKIEQWDSTHARYISTPKMTSWGRALADNLRHSTVEFKTRVAPLHNNQGIDKKTELFDETGTSLGHFDWVICTTPNVQTLELMADSGFSKQTQITQPKMLACYTLMLGWENLASLPKSLNPDLDIAWDVAYPQDSILAKIFVEHQKPNHDELLPSVTIHASNDWSQMHVDDDVETIQAQLLIAAQQALNWNEATAPSQVDCHRWRYAATVVNKGDKELGILVDKDHNWIVSGDWCGQGNIESCYLMAERVVEVVTGVVNL